jgi:hypothetical protein
MRWIFPGGFLPVSTAAVFGMASKRRAFLQSHVGGVGAKNTEKEHVKISCACHTKTYRVSNKKVLPRRILGALQKESRLHKILTITL